jgi:2,4-dienoyl-CoA reductase-like NADH-dependent reductase (Old Yellow Enzyme family)/thioredoxin reductase
MRKLLGSPGRIAHLELKNRMVLSPMLTCLADRDGQVTQEMLAYYAERARGGAALVMTEYSFVDDEASKSIHGQLSASHDDRIPGLARLADTIHEGGALAGLQIAHTGRQRFIGEKPMLAPSRVPWDLLYAAGAPVPDEASIEQLHEIAQAFGRAAARARLAGFDLVELHSGHGYLLGETLSRHTNRRTDLYGGDLASRQRFVLEVVAAVRAAVGSQFPITARLSGSEHQPNGTSPEETAETAKRLEEAGVAAVDISGGNHETPDTQVQPMYYEPGFNAANAKLVKQRVSIPVSVVGSINRPEVAEAILEEGAADFVRMARPLLADPYLPQKILDGREADIRPCVRCVQCLDRGISRQRSVICAVNFAGGREYAYNSEDAGRTANPVPVAVIGGGPAGLEAARVAALRGHGVTLFERDRIGGTLLEAGRPSFKRDLLLFVEYLVGQVSKTVDIVEDEASVAILRERSPAVVILATGAVPIDPSIPGLAPERVIDARSALRKGIDQGSVLVDGGHRFAAEVAWALAQEGKRVTIVNPEDILAGEAGPNLRRPLLARLGELGVTSMTGTRLVAGSATGCVVEDIATGARTEVACDVVVTTAYAPDSTLRDALADGPWRIHVVGDALAARELLDAVHSANIAARSF